MVELEEDDDYLLSIVTGFDGFHEKYSESKFKHYLNPADDLSSNREVDGWVFWRESESQINAIIKSLLQDCLYPSDYIVQFWAAKEEGEQVNYLITSDQPFAVVGYDLYKGLCWYRKLCLNYRYYTEMGAVGRAYQSKHPESSPDLRLYSTSEFPLRDNAARCGLRGYMAMPIFDLNNSQHCYGVLEFLCFGHQTISHISLFLLFKGLRSVHANHAHVSDIPKSERQLIEIAEIKKMVEQAMDVVPQLHMAVVWIPCKQCSEDISTDNLSCMEISKYMTYSNASFDYSHEYSFNNVRKVNLVNKKSSFCGNICDFRISAENPRARFAQLLRLSVRYEIFLESMQNSNEVYIVEFFLQSNNNREDGSFVYMLSRIMERVLKSIKLSPGGQLGDEDLVVEPPHALRHESINYTQERKNQLLEEINMLEVIEGYNEEFSLMDFTKYLQKTDPFFGEQKIEGGFFWRRNLFQPHVILSVEDKITHFMSQIMHEESYSLVQFWAPKFEDNRCYITTLDQPFAVGSLKKGLASFRKESMKHVYYVDEGAKGEQVGPPGRVFRSRSSEFTPDMRLYSTTEFPLKNHAARCRLREYFVLPIFYLLEREECVGVLEFVGFTYFPFEDIQKELEAANLSVSFQASHMQTDITDSRQLALREIKEALKVVIKIPQLHMVQVWATCTRCPSEKDISLNCMELTDFMQESYEESNSEEHIYYSKMIEFSHIHTRKGITRMVLASENKSCFFRNSCHFSIVEQPLAHFMQKERTGSCFAICLQSTHTGNLVYVLEFFLNQGPGKYEHIVSLLNFLLPILKKYLKSFTIASGQQLGDELAIEVPVFPGEDELILSEINGPQNKFKFVPYSVREHQHSGHQQRPIIIVDDTDSVTSTSHAEHLISSVAANSKKIKGGKKMKKTGRLNLTLEALKPHFGTKLKDVAKELEVSKSTIKRACREYGIDRWPCNEKHKKNPSLFEVERADKDSQKNICLRQNLAQASTDQSSSSHLNVQTIKADTVIVKAKYDADTIRFELGLPLGMEKLVEEVANRLKLEMGSFKLKYLDEENEEILLTRDADLLHCPKYPTASGESFIKLFVRLSRK